MTIRALFFDFDDTLCATSRSRPERTRLVFEALREAFPDLVHEDFAGRILAPRDLTAATMAEEAVLREMGVWDTPLGQKAHELFFFNGCTHLVQPYDGMRDVLAVLQREYWLGVITNGLVERQRRKYEALDVAAFFSGIVISGEIGHHKPAPEIYAHALSLAGVAPHEAVMIGDNLEADIRGANQAGMRTIWFNAEEQVAPPDAAVPNAIVTGWAELLAVLEKWE